MSEKTEICLVTPSHLGSAPRVVKEAEALSEAGFGVTVISTRNSPAADPLDEQILREAKWKSRRVNLLGGGRLRRALVQKMAKPAFLWFGSASPLLAALAESGAFPALRREAEGCPARLYIGHCLTGLAAALSAGISRGAKIGFDAEDYHEAERLPEQTGEVGIQAARILQREAWQRCDHLTAAAPLIAQKLGEEYGRQPEVILNVFPKRMAPARPPRERPARRPVRLYWFSQTIGPGRGLEEVMEACRLLDFPVEVHLRGHDETGFAARLRERLANGTQGHALVVEELAAPEEMARLAAECDIGLGLEQNLPLNRGICLTNKIFTYLLAGIPMVLSDTPAHRELAPRLGSAAMLADPAKPAELAAAVTRLAGDAAGGREAAEQAWRLGQERYHWDFEKKKFVELVRRAIGPEAARG